MNDCSWHNNARCLFTTLTISLETQPYLLLPGGAAEEEASTSQELVLWSQGDLGLFWRCHLPAADS